MNLSDFADEIKGQLSQTKAWLFPNEPGPVEKACIVVGQTGHRIHVMYNPTTLKFSRNVSFKECGQLIQADRVKNGDLTISLFFDTFEAQTDVRAKTDEIVALTNFSSGTDLRKMPPTVQLVWDRPLYIGIVTKVEQTFTMFLPSGIPVRATLDVTFTEEPSERERERNSGATNCRKLWTVSRGDRLSLIAQQAYGDSTRWPLIAQANGIRDALAFPTSSDVGEVIVIPDIHNVTYEPAAGNTYE